MSFSGLSINTGVHVCLPYFQEMKRCHDTHNFNRKACADYVDDYLECHNKNKMKQMIGLAEKDRRSRNVVYDVPYYDMKQDAFVYDSGKVVSNSDPIFEKFKWS